MLNVNSPIIKSFIKDHFDNFNPKDYKFDITQDGDTVTIVYTNVEYKLTNTHYLFL